MTGFSDSKILLIGAGKMGVALLAAWLHKGARQITVIEENTSNAEQAKKLDASVNVVNFIDQTTSSFDVVVLAVKPQSMDALLPQLAVKYGNASLYLSIAAGKTLSYFEKQLGDAPVVRAMPNTPALIGKGISALIANKKVSDTHKKLAEQLLRAAGEIVWLENESQMDAVTAISGSGPAYVFLFLEALIEAGSKQGLPEAIAKQLALQTLLGSSELAKHSDESLAQLRKNVTSPGGTTEAALAVLMKNNQLSSLINEGVTAAVKRSKELS